ncbi:MAG: phosphatase PAP2 family protein [Candidatus Poseidoniales archaeon]
MKADVELEPHKYSSIGFHLITSATRVQLFCAYLACIGVLIGLPYLLINNYIPRMWESDLNVEIALDSSIPFIPYSLIAYFSLYLYYPIFAYILTKDDQRPQGLEIIKYFLMMTWFSFFFFIALPTEIQLRHQLHANQFEQFYQIMHFVDNPYNAWPSLHVSHSLFIILASVHLKSATREISQQTKIMLIAVWLCLVISTLTTKQHYVFDAVSGALVGWGAWKLYQRNSKIA